MSSFPIQLASRLVLDSISYSNCLPPWLDGIEINFADWDRPIRKRIQEYLNGRKPEKPFAILVPKKNGSKKRWLIPSVADQVVLQAAVSGLARRVIQRVDDKRVFSYRYNRDPDRLLFVESQIHSWTQFQERTESRLKQPSSFMLQLDLESAYGRIQRGKFYDFLEQVAGGGDEVKIIRLLIDGFAGEEEGLPLVNDSVFFLGNVYLSTVDEIIRRETRDFIRFVDDYRIFADSKEALSNMFARIHRALAGTNFVISTPKVKIGSSSEYLDAIRKAGNARTEEHDYISPAILTDVMPPEGLVELVAQVINQPDEFMNEALGRFLLGAVRRMRLDDDVAKQMKYNLGSPRSQFDAGIRERKGLVDSAVQLLERYSSQEDEAWRAVWIAYVFSEYLPKWICKAIRDNHAVPAVVQLWTVCAERPVKEGPDNSAFPDDLNYLEEGRKYHG
jgi:hypothetical protein